MEEKRGLRQAGNLGVTRKETRGGSAEKKPGRITAGKSDEEGTEQRKTEKEPAAEDLKLGGGASRQRLNQKQKKREDKSGSG